MKRVTRRMMRTMKRRMRYDYGIFRGFLGFQMRLCLGSVNYGIEWLVGILGLKDH